MCTLQFNRSVLKISARLFRRKNLIQEFCILAYTSMYTCVIYVKYNMGIWAAKNLILVITKSIMNNQPVVRPICG